MSLMLLTYIGHIILYTSCCFYYRKSTLKLVLYFRSLILSSLVWMVLKNVLYEF